MGARFLESDEGNPDGYFEDVDFLETHRRFFSHSEAEAGRVLEDSSMREAPFSPGLVEADWECARRLLEQRGALGKPWGWKDPRTCFFLPIWHTLMPQANYPVIYRHPLVMGASLLRMGKNWDSLFDPLLPLRAWTFAMREVLQFLAQLPEDRFLIFEAEALWTSPEHLAKNLSDRWQIPLEVSTLLEIRRPRDHAPCQTINRRQHAVFARYFPEAANIFDQLQELAAIPLSMPDVPMKADPILDLLESQEVAPELAIQLLYDSILPHHRLLHQNARQEMASSAKAYLRERFKRQEVAQVAYDQQDAYIQELLQALEANRKQFIELLEHSKKQKEHIAKLSEFINSVKGSQKGGK